MWLHAAVLDIFRPFIERGAEPALLRTFSPPDSTVLDAYQASVNQLKHLVVHFRHYYESSTCTMLWQPALIYVANAMIQDVTTPQWRVYFLACFYGLEALRRPFRVSEAIGRGLLTMLMRDDKLSSKDAREALGHLRQRGFDDIPGDIRATFMGDLELAQTNPGAANMENLAAGFEDIAVFQEFIGYQDT